MPTTTTFRFLLFLLIGCLSNSAIARLNCPPIVSSNLWHESTEYHVSTGATAKTQKVGWLQFGHAFGWKNALSIQKLPYLRLNWRKKVGAGAAQIVGDESMLIVASGDAPSKTEVRTFVASYSTENGIQNWRYEFNSERIATQEAFGGRNPNPQATPLIANGKVLFVTFTGELICLDAKTGKEQWKESLPDKYGAEPVQFGFSSSPVRCPDDDDHFMVLAAGSEGGLLKKSTDDGSVIWRSPVPTFSYATPVFASLGGKSQWIIVSQDEVGGIADTDGAKLWSFPLAEKGLTNVPTPLVINENRILISGQGVGGTACVEINQKQGQWTAEEVWKNPRMKFFYTNWVKLNDSVTLACTDKYLTAFQNRDGEQLGRWRGFGDGNLVQLQEQLLLLTGKGQLNVLEFDESKQVIEVKHRFLIKPDRFWVTPSIINDSILVRHGDSLVSLSFAGEKPDREVKSTMGSVSESKLAFAEKKLENDAVESILVTFQNQGQNAAMRLYERLRRKGKLTAENRIELAEAAYENKLFDIAKLVMQHAQADLPESKLIKQKMKAWSGN